MLQEEIDRLVVSGSILRSFLDICRIVLALQGRSGQSHHDTLL
jgi:hypothetical protein